MRFTKIFQLPLILFIFALIIGHPSNAQAQDMKDCPEMGKGHDMANCPMRATTVSDKSDKSKYAGMERRPIKALSEEQIDGYRNGEGMGMAMPAELNHYPGPKHVLSASNKLALTSEQEKGLNALYDAMHEQAVTLGDQIVEKESTLDSLFENHAITAERLRELTGEIGVLQGKLRATHIEAHLATRSLLTEEQIKKYDALRGYGKAAKHSLSKHM